MPNCFSVRFTTFVEKLLSKKNSDRPTAKEALGLIPSFVKQSYTEKFHPDIKDKEGSLNLISEETKDCDLEVWSMTEIERPIISWPKEDFLF